jgi:PBS lyase HEAT-like repeat
MLLAAFERTTGQQKSPPRRSVQHIVQQNLTKDLEDDEDGARQLFLLGDEAVSPLIKFLSGPNKEKRASAAKALAYIGNAQGMHALRNAVQSERDKEAKSVMSFFLAGGLVGTTSESDLNFLKSSIETARSADDDDETAMPALSAEVTFNRERNRVLVSLEIYKGPKSARGYNLALSKRNGEWKVVGIWFAWVA